MEYNLKEQLIQKSIEAFILGLEIHNKPTIKYRIEGFSFFICNAWELMLKAQLINKNINIYYENKSQRTLTLSETIKKIYSDKNEYSTPPEPLCPVLRATHSVERAIFLFR